MASENGEPRRGARRDLLASYYGGAEENGSKTVDPCDINATSFEPDAYLNKLIKEQSLTELMDRENEMRRHIRSLDSDMQTLVYENYNKFISATDTIRKMKTDFKKMEDEMDRLAMIMNNITDFSGKISDTLQDRRSKIVQLTGVHTLLKKLQFLFELPARLKKCIELKAYRQAVRYYTRSQKVLHQYQHMPSFSGILDDCNKIVVELREELRDQFRNKDANQKQLAECVDLLLQLHEPPEVLCEEFLSHARQRLDVDLAGLERQLRLKAGETVEPPGDDGEKRPSDAYLNTPMDILEYMDCGCNGFLSNVCLVIASYKEMFLSRNDEFDNLEEVANQKLVYFVTELMNKYFDFIQRRVQLERETGDNTILVRALDRFHRRLQAMNKLLDETDFARAGADIVIKAASERVNHYLVALQQHLQDCLTDIRQNLASPRLLPDTNTNLLQELLHSSLTSVVDQVKAVLNNLQGFCDQQVERGSVPPTLMLLMSRLCLDLDTSTISYLLTLCDEQFLLTDVTVTTSCSQLSKEARDCAQHLLNHYVRIQGHTISQMLRKSVETRDWLNTIEPRNVRAVMKRVVEDITAMDTQVGQLYEEGSRKDRSSDSTKRSASHMSRAAPTRTNWSFTPSTFDNSLMSNIQKLFNEKIEVFGAVEFSKVSVLTGVIKISLKTFVECVRLRTFGRFGLQQMQVDTHYLQLYLWRFVSDENLVHFLLDEIVGSTAHRCLDPVTMEPSVVELICERG